MLLCCKKNLVGNKLGKDFDDTILLRETLAPPNKHNLQFCKNVTFDAGTNFPAEIMKGCVT